ncbi:MAG: hypothetical protein ABW007_08955, partial [Chitinophagaceae bacterium]
AASSAYRCVRRAPSTPVYTGDNPKSSIENQHAITPLSFSPYNFMILPPVFLLSIQICKGKEKRECMRACLSQPPISIK